MVGQVLTVLASVLGAFMAAWVGAYFGFRRTKRERALDRRVAWHERAVDSLVEYENALEHLHRDSRNALLVRHRSEEGSGPKTREEAKESLSRTFRPEPTVWKQVAGAEQKVRSALRWADMYTEGMVRIRCSAALAGTVDLVSGHWFDVSESPEIPWVDLKSRIFQVGDLRRALQQSLRIALELDGWYASIRGEEYRRKRELEELEKIKEKLAWTRDQEARRVDPENDERDVG